MTPPPRHTYGYLTSNDRNYDQSLTSNAANALLRRFIVYIINWYLLKTSLKEKNRIARPSSRTTHYKMQMIVLIC